MAATRSLNIARGRCGRCGAAGAARQWGAECKYMIYRQKHHAGRKQASRDAESRCTGTCRSPTAARLRRSLRARAPSPPLLEGRAEARVLCPGPAAPRRAPRTAPPRDAIRTIKITLLLALQRSDKLLIFDI